MMAGLGELFPFAFLRPGFLFAAIFWLGLSLFLARRHLGAWQFLEIHISERFRSRYTAYGSAKSLRRHFYVVALLGVLLTLAAAGPTLEDETEVEREGGDVILLLDASQSMSATDLATAAEEDLSRFSAAVRLAREIVAGLPEHRFAVFTWSGSATPEMPMTSDRTLIEDALHHAEPHTIYQSSGTHFAAALDAILPFTGQGRNLQAVILSDGEQPFEEDYDDALRAVVEAGVPVHGVAIGTGEGQKRVYSDVSEDQKAFKVDFRTRRVDRHLSRMADMSGGMFTAVESWPSEVTADIAVYTIDAFEGDLGRLDEELFRAEKTARDRGRIFLALFLVLYLLHGAVIGRRRRDGDADFDLALLGMPAAPEKSRRSETAVSSMALLLILLVACSPSPLEMAHRENEKGLRWDQAGLLARARIHFERSRAYGEQAHIPTHNLARTLTRDGQYSEAHDFFEEAMRLSPNFAEAQFGDGVALFEWGKSERDPENCRLERTQELWRAALARFEAFEEKAADGHELVAEGIANAREVRDQLTEVEALIEEPPPACRQPPPPSPSPPDPDENPRGGDPGGGDPGGGQGDSGTPPPPSPPPPAGGGSSPPSSPLPPPPPQGQNGGGTGGGLSEEEREQIRQALERIATDSRAEGVYHRRTKPAQWQPGMKATERIWW